MLIKKMIPWKLHILNSNNSGVFLSVKNVSFHGYFFSACLHRLTHSHTFTGRISSAETYITSEHDYTTKPHDLNGNTLKGIFNKVILR